VRDGGAYANVNPGISAQVTQVLSLVSSDVNPGRSQVSLKLRIRFSLTGLSDTGYEFECQSRVCRTFNLNNLTRSQNKPPGDLKIQKIV